MGIDRMKPPKALRMGISDRRRARGSYLFGTLGRSLTRTHTLIAGKRPALVFARREIARRSAHSYGE